MKTPKQHIKIHPKSSNTCPQMASKGAFQRPSEPLGASFGYRPYFRTLLDVFFCHLGSTLASHGGPFWRPFGLLFLSWGLQEPKIGGFWGVCFQLHFLNDFWYYFGWVLDLKNLDLAREGYQKSRFRLSRFFDHFGDHFGPHFGPKMDPKSHLDSSWRPYVAILALFWGGTFF